MEKVGAPPICDAHPVAPAAPVVEVGQLWQEEEVQAPKEEGANTRKFIIVEELL
jgi:hypothetical protein